jgi:hypothetical protein
MIGTGHFDYGDFPISRIEDDLRLLTPKQRQSLLAIVKAMADPEGKGVRHVAKPNQKSAEELLAEQVDAEDYNPGADASTPREDPEASP